MGIKGDTVLTLGPRDIRPGTSIEVVSVGCGASMLSIWRSEGKDSRWRRGGTMMWDVW